MCHIPNSWFHQFPTFNAKRTWFPPSWPFFRWNTNDWENTVLPNSSQRKRVSNVSSGHFCDPKCRIGNLSYMIYSHSLTTLLLQLFLSRTHILTTYLLILPPTIPTIPTYDTHKSSRLSPCAADHFNIVSSLTKEQLNARYPAACKERWGGPSSEHTWEVDGQEGIPLKALLRPTQDPCQHDGSDGEQVTRLQHSLYIFTITSLCITHIRSYTTHPIIIYHISSYPCLHTLRRG